MRFSNTKPMNYFEGKPIMSKESIKSTRSIKFTMAIKSMFMGVIKRLIERIIKEPN